MVLEELNVPEGISNVLIAGGAGFIGSHIVKQLLGNESTEKVLVVDNFSSGTIENLEGVLGDDRLEILQMDIADPSVVENAGKDLDLVLHLAAVANPLDYEKRPLETLLVNSDGSHNLIEIAEKNGSKYVFFSSSEVYGNYNKLPCAPMSETSESRIFLNRKRSPYVVGKCFGEEITIHLCGKKGIDHLIIRPFNIYGPNMDLKTNYGRVIPNFSIWGLKGQTMKVHGDGTQIRTFCYIEDLISGLFSLLDKKISGQSVNIGHPHPISILDLAKMVSDILQIEQDLEFVERYEFEPYIRIPDLKLIKDLAGWEPSIDLRTGLTRTIDWFRTVGMTKYPRNSS